MNLPGVIAMQKAPFIPPSGREVAWGAVQSPPCERGVPRQRRGGGIPWLSGFHMGLFTQKVPAVNPSVTAKATGGSPAVPAPFRKGAFGCTADTGRVWEVTMRRKLPCEIDCGGTPPLWQGSLWLHCRYRAGQGSNDA